MLCDENSHDDQDNKHNDQGGPPDAAASCRKVPRVIVVRHLNPGNTAPCATGSSQFRPAATKAFQLWPQADGTDDSGLP
jgi:hypothetical protein